jgi:hypothetical protein
LRYFRPEPPVRCTYSMHSGLRKGLSILSNSESSLRTARRCRRGWKPFKWRMRCSHSACTQTVCPLTGSEMSRFPSESRHRSWCDQARPVGEEWRCEGSMRLCWSCSGFRSHRLGCSNFSALGVYLHGGTNLADPAVCSQREFSADDSPAVNRPALSQPCGLQPENFSSAADSLAVNPAQQVERERRERRGEPGALGRSRFTARPLSLWPVRPHATVVQKGRAVARNPAPVRGLCARRERPLVSSSVWLLR